MMCNVDTKECTTCHEVKSLADFYFNKKNGKTGRPYSCCKECHKARTSRWHKKNPNTRRENTWKFRGISCTVEQYEQMLDEQDSSCAICKKPCGSGRRLAVDHNHETGAVRGLLCLSCNQLIGKLENGTVPLRRLLTYLKEELENGSLT